MTGKLIIITGPSGVGKTTIVNRILDQEPEITRVLNYTTRKPRDHEQNQVDYNFIDTKDFEKKIKQGFFLEYANVYGNYYGNSLEEIINLLEKGQHVIMTTDIQGVKNIEEKMPETLTIFIKPDNLDNLKKRLKKRNLPKEIFEQRWQKVQEEMQQADLCDYQVINAENKISETVDQVLKIIKKTKQ